MFILRSDNVFEYLSQQSIEDSTEQYQSKVEPISAKNFNLLVTFPDNHKLLVKQERHNLEGETAGEFKSEYRIQEWLQQFPEQNSLRPFLPELLHFDAENSIIIFRYLDDYRDLMDFYAKESSFPTEISSTIGTLLATIHRDTYQQENHRQFFEGEANNQVGNQVPRLIKGLERIKPEIFSSVPGDALKFFALYQRYDSLGMAIAELGNAFTPAC
ncbi:MAG: aminoglycoside phosphotransferase family protein, partial [Waterburya sp.]